MLYMKIYKNGSQGRKWGLNSMVRPKVEDWLCEKGIAKLQDWASRGLSNEQIADNMGIVTSTFYRWVSEHKELKDAIKTTKDICDLQVENALFRRAVGYSYDEEVTEKINQDGQEIIVSRKTTRKTIPPDTAALIFWLKNRKPEEWKDKQIVDASIADENIKTMQDYMESLKNGEFKNS